MKKGFIYLSILSMALAMMAFQCTSAELTGAKMYINQKQYEKAKEALLKEVEKNPASDEGWYLLGFLYGEESNYDKMIDAYDKSLKASKKFEAQITESKKYFWATSFNRGVIFYNRAVKTADADSSKMFFEKAADMFKASSIFEPDSIIGYSNLAMTYIAMNRIDDAIAPLEKATFIGKSSDVFIMLGQIYLENGNALLQSYETSKKEEEKIKADEYINKSVKVLEEGRSKFPEDGDILLRLSNAYIAGNKLDVALNAFKDGIEKEPGNKYYQYNYAVLLLNAKDYTGAEEHFKKAVEIDSEYSNAVYNLAVTYVRWGAQIRDDLEAKGDTSDKYKEKFSLAIPHLEKYLTVNPKEPAVWELLGKVYANLGMTEKSIDAFKKADQYR